MTEIQIIAIILEELKKLFDEYYVDYDQDDFYENYLDFADGALKNNLGIKGYGEHVEPKEFAGFIRDVVISELLCLLRNETE